jgi:hypothetical protein
MQLVRGLHEKGRLETLPDGVKLYTLFNNKVPWACFSEADLRALGDAMTQVGMQGSSALAGYTYLGQFLAHDLSKLRIEGHNKVVKSFTTDVLRSDVTPVLDLGSVYDGAKTGSRLRDGDSAHMALGAAQRKNGCLLEGYDLPRENGQACIGDDRNDENLIVSQLHVQFLRLHNYFVDRIAAEQPNLDAGALFKAAQKQVIYHYQEVILYDFLYELLHPAVWKSIILENRSILWNPRPNEEAVLPIEYAAAAGRFGHAMVRNEYDLNRTTDIKMTGLFSMTGAGRFGGRHAALPATHLVDWLLFFDFPTIKRAARPKRNPSRRISPRVHVALENTDSLPQREDKNLATRNLLRGYQMRLGSGQATVHYVRTRFRRQLADCNIPIRPLTRDELNLNKPDDPQCVLDNCNPALSENTPLWFYLLAEASCTETVEGIGKLGPLGSLIIAESIKGLLKLDRTSVLHVHQRRTDITPTKEIAGRRFLQMSDLILATNPELPDPTRLQETVLYR